MTIDYATALASMRLRRIGEDALTERYQKRATEPAIQYTLGAMQEVDPQYTAISVSEGTRVGTHVKDSVSFNVDLKLQGSVPLNTHIRKSSDVDVLVIIGSFFSYSDTGPKAAGYRQSGGYPNALSDMQKLRKECEEVLTSRYHAAKVNTTGGKSIAVSGGSLVRKVDIVPANWFDGDEYQDTGYTQLRGINVFDKNTNERPRNWPFLFMHEINLADTRTQGGTKRAIRLLKTIANDSSTRIEISSYDIASVVWNMPVELLNSSGPKELSILAAVQSYLEYLRSRVDFAKSLDTPDKSRKVFDKQEKMAELVKLGNEVDSLSRKVYDEVYSKISFGSIANGAATPEQVRKALFESVVAA